MLLGLSYSFLQSWCQEFPQLTVIPKVMCSVTAQLYTPQVNDKACNVLNAAYLWMYYMTVMSCLQCSVIVYKKSNTFKDFVLQKNPFNLLTVAPHVHSSSGRLSETPSKIIHSICVFHLNIRRKKQFFHFCHPVLAALLTLLIQMI